MRRHHYSNICPGRSECAISRRHSSRHSNDRYRQDRASESIDINKIDKIELKANATGINPITGKADGKIIVKADGYGFDVSGLANGADVMVYSQNGMLIGKAKAKGGSAHVDAASYPNGVYVIKAGGRSLKMVKK